MPRAGAGMSSKRLIVCGDGTWNDADSADEFYNVIERSTAQSGPPPKPSGSVNIHQVQVAFIGSGAVGGGTLYYGRRSYPFKLGSRHWRDWFDIKATDSVD